MNKKFSDAAYSFHKKLNISFKDTYSLLNYALPLLGRSLDLDRLYFFDLTEDLGMISLTLFCKEGVCMDMQENISLHNRRDFVDALIKKGIYASEDLTYPAVYVLLKWKTPRMYAKDIASNAVLKERLGVLRLERATGENPFTEDDLKLVLALADELSQNMVNTEIDQDNHERLRVAEGLNELGAVFAKSLRFKDGIEAILKGVQKYFRFDRTRLYLFDYKGKTVTGLLSTDISGEVSRMEGKISSDEVQAILATDIFHSARALNLPLSVQGKRVGVLMLDNILSRRNISQADFLHLKQFSSQIALAIDNAMLFERVQDLYNYDDLTKLPVRRYFMEKLNEEIYRSKRFDLTMSLIILDLDWFKEINDTYGHQTGDWALITVADAIMNSLRQTDFPCRFGGDEIMIMLPRTSVQEARFIAKRLSEKIKSIALPEEMTGGKEVFLSVTQGISLFPLDGKDAPELIHKADTALYYSKQRRRGTITVYRDVEDEILKEEQSKEKEEA